MKRISAYRLSKIACDALLKEGDEAYQFRRKCARPDAEMSRETALEMVTQCMSRATSIWNASAIFIAPPLSDSSKQIKAVAAMYRVVMNDMTDHIRTILKS